MKASEPRTFSWISTKISMSAKRRTTALVERQPEPIGDGVGERRVGIAGDQLDRAVLGRHRGLLPVGCWRPFSAYRVSLGTGWFRRAREYQGGDAKGNPRRAISWAKMAVAAGIWLMVGVAQSRKTTGSARPARRRSRPPVPRPAGRRGRLRRAVDHAGQPAQARLRDLAQHEVVGGAPGSRKHRGRPCRRASWPDRRSARCWSRS